MVKILVLFLLLPLKIGWFLTVKKWEDYQPQILYFLNKFSDRWYFFLKRHLPHCLFATTPLISSKLWLSPVIMVIKMITACAVATSCCISDVPSQWEGQNFDPSQLPHFSTDLNETWNQERYPGYDPTCKIWLMWDDGKGVCVGRAFSVTFCVLSFFCILAHAYRSHQKTDHDR